MMQGLTQESRRKSQEESTELLLVMNKQLRCTPFDFELSEFFKELEINAEPIYSRQQVYDGN